MPEWYTRKSESTSSIDCVRTSASSLILDVASLILKGVARLECYRKSSTGIRTNLVVAELQAELLDARLDGIPYGQTMSIARLVKCPGHWPLYAPDRDVARQAEVLWLEDLVRAWVVEDGLGVDTSLMGKCAVATAKQGR